MTLCSHTVTRNGGIFIEPCLRQILPYVDRALVSVDMGSEDGTIETLKKLSREYPKLELDYYTIGHEFGDLQAGIVKARDNQIRKTNEDWFWIVDDDEYYLDKDIRQIVKDLENEKEYSIYTLCCWLLNSKNSAHSRCSNKHKPVIFKNKVGLEWGKAFPDEVIYYEGEILHKNYKIQRKHEARYIHFSYLKKWSWRNTYNKRFLLTEKRGEIPQHIINEVNKIYENCS